jgi:ParB/RepB/Spo0J family partition protein
MATSESDGKAVGDPARPADPAPGGPATPSDGRSSHAPDRREAPARRDGRARRGPDITFVVTDPARLRITRKAPGAGAAASRTPIRPSRTALGRAPRQPSAEDGLVFLTVATDRLHSCRLRRRKAYPETAVASFADALEIKGWHQPFLVRPHPAKPGHYEVVVGDLPVQAARRAEFAHMPVAVCALSDLRALECALLEDLRRPDLTPLEVAAALRQLIDACDHSHAELARLLGRTERQVAELLRLLERSAASADAPAGKARAPAPTSLGAAMAALERRLAARLGLSVGIASHDQRGGVTIAFESVEQLERIVRRLLAPAAASASQGGAHAGAAPASAELAA